MFRSKVPIDSMTVTHSKVPSILNVAKVLTDEIIVLISLAGLVRDISTSCFD